MQGEYLLILIKGLFELAKEIENGAEHIWLVILHLEQVAFIFSLYGGDIRLALMVQDSFDDLAGKESH